MHTTIDSAYAWLAHGLSQYWSLPVILIAATMILLQKAGWLAAPGFYDSGSTDCADDCDSGD